MAQSGMVLHAKCFFFLHAKYAKAAKQNVVKTYAKGAKWYNNAGKVMCECIRTKNT